MMVPGFPNAMPEQGIIGGVLIGLAAALMLLGSGRIAGVSGITARAVRLTNSDAPTSAVWLFIAGLLAGTGLVHFVIAPVQSDFTGSIPLLIAAGVITGFGTRLGSGCTSGHGVCGMSRLSPRSLMATAIFMAAGMLTVAFANFMGWGW